MATLNFIEILKIGRRLGLSMRVLGFMMLLQLLSVCFEVVGISMLLPIFQLLRAGHTVSVDQLQGRFWEVAREVSAYVGIPITLGLLLSISFGNIVLRQVFAYFNARYNGIVKRRTADRLRQKAFYQFIMARTSLQDEAAVGGVVSILKIDLPRALDTLFSVIRSASTAVHLLVYVVGLFLLSWPMTLLSLGMIAIAALFARGQLAKIRKGGDAFSVTNRALTIFMVERLKHARLIRLSGTEKAESRAIYDLSRRNSQEMLHQSLTSIKLTLMPEPIAVGFAYVVLFVGGNLLGFSLERLGLFVVILIRLMPIIRTNIAQYTALLGKVPSLEKLNTYFIETQKAREPKGGSQIFERLDSAIAYDHVSFSYPDNEVPALMDVTTSIPAQRMTALIGPSGSGKSTFIDMLPRLRIPSKGEIAFDGVPIAEFTLQSLRAGIAFVPQQPQIFDSSAAEHIRYGKNDATDSEVREAARLAGALEFIERLPEGFDTLLGDGGKRLSGGQRQRLDIARALVRRAPVLILDEPTSALDAEAEVAFRDALRTLRTETNLTIIVIAHRLSTIADADQIIVLESGRVTGVGTHDQLVKAGGWYAEAYRAQHGDDAWQQTRAMTAGPVS